MLTGTQIRMARAVLQWRVDDLAKESEVPWARIQQLERCNDVLNSSDEILTAIIQAFELHGIDFVNEDENWAPTVRIRK